MESITLSLIRVAEHSWTGFSCLAGSWNMFNCKRNLNTNLTA